MSDKEVNKKNILLCVAGATPQIITETLYALTIQRGERAERVDEIRVITTLDGHDKIMTGCIKKRGSVEESLLDPAKGQFFNFLRDYPQVGEIKFDKTKIALLDTPDGRTLEDIRTSEENALAGDKICEIVRELCNDDNVQIHASAAGGRKTMGIYLTAAMQLFGRPNDMLSHVLVNEDFEGHTQFFYPPPTPKILETRDGRKVSTDKAKIYLAEVPFIRLRGIGSELLKSNGVSYDELVRQAQENLGRFDLQINLGSGTVKVGKRPSFKLTDYDTKGQQEKRITKRHSNPDSSHIDQLFFVYVLFAFLRLQDRGEGGLVQVEEIPLEDFDAVCRLISRARGEEAGYQNFDLLRADSLQSLNLSFFREKNPNRSAEYALMMVKTTIGGAISDIKRALKKNGIGEEFAIINKRKNRKKVEPLYGLQIEAERIKFE